MDDEVEELVKQKLQKAKNTFILPPYLRKDMERIACDPMEKISFEVVIDDGKPSLFDNPNLGTFISKWIDDRKMISVDTSL